MLVDELFPTTEAMDETGFKPVVTAAWEDDGTVTCPEAGWVFGKMYWGLVDGSKQATSVELPISNASNPSAPESANRNECNPDRIPFGVNGGGLFPLPPNELKKDDTEVGVVITDDIGGIHTPDDWLVNIDPPFDDGLVAAEFSVVNECVEFGE